MTGQKEAVVAMVKHMLPTFRPYKDIALVMLTSDQLEQMKINIGQYICGGTIEYSKPIVTSEVMAYARSMVMNHLKKSKELNGNVTYAVAPTPLKTSKKLQTVNMEILPKELQEFVKTLV